MPRAVGVTFGEAGKVYYFDPGDLDLHEGDAVVARTSRGLELGQVVVEVHQISEQEANSGLKRITRRAADRDLEQDHQNRAREREAFHVCLDRIASHGLPMKLVEAEYTLDRARLMFAFTAEGRIDFRDLVRDLASTFHTRIELRQIGVRDEAKLIDGLGACGRRLCCSSFLAQFEPVGIKMAKEQGLALNPNKISGICGRLMCCLAYEYPFYHDARQCLPKVGSQVVTAKGQGKIVDVNVPQGMLIIKLSEGAQMSVAASEARRLCQCPCDQPCVHNARPGAAVEAQPEAPPGPEAPPAPQPQPAAKTDESAPSPGRSSRRRRRRRPRRSSGDSG